MGLAQITIAVITFLVVLPWALKAFCASRRAIGYAATVAILATVAGFTWATRSYDPSNQRVKRIVNRPLQEPDRGYVSSTACRACHPDQYDTWHDSFHRTMTQLATPESVVGTFDGLPFDLDGKVYRLERIADQFWAEFDDPDRNTESGPPPRIRRQLVMTTGSHHMQVYWYPTGKKRKLGQLPIIYLFEKHRWIPRIAAFLTPRLDPAPSETGRWNKACSNCHATRVKPRLFSEDGFDTTVTELGIACEACHGPALDHIRANHNTLRRYELHLTGKPDPTIVNPRKLSLRRTSQVCGQCHSVWSLYSRKADEQWADNGYTYRPGDNLDDTRRIVHEPRLPSAFWPDGMVRVSGREFSGMSRSPCYLRGEMTCLSCHTLHQKPDDPRPTNEWTDDQLAPQMRSDHACLQCHDSFKSNLEEHTFHRKDSTGSRCQNCHMPHTTYGLLKAMPSHEIDSPSVSVTLSTGRPNACNQCHLDKTLGWTAEYLNRWYQIRKPELSNEEQTISASVLWLLRGDAGLRAITAWTFGWSAAQQASRTDWLAPYLAQLLVDPYPAVRFIAARSLQHLDEFAEFDYDYVANAEHRSDARGRVLDIWNSSRSQGSPTIGNAILILPNGELNQKMFDRLVGQRDDHVMSLDE